jgi:hypothetical protein
MSCGPWRKPCLGRASLINFSGPIARVVVTHAFLRSLILRLHLSWLTRTFISLDFHLHSGNSKHVRHNNLLLRFHLLLPGVSGNQPKRAISALHDPDGIDRRYRAKFVTFDKWYLSLIRPLDE